MSLVVVGTNHKYSPIEIRERIAFSKSKLKEALIALTDYRQIKAGLILSTCNRVELYVHAQDAEEAAAILKDFLAGYHEVALPVIEPYLYTYIGKEALIHLFSVASGLDSQIIGEAQILEQVMLAYQEAKKAEAADRLLDVVFESVMRVALKVKQETTIANDALSLAGIALELIKNRCGFIKDKNVLIIGTGKIAESAAKYCQEEKIKTVFVANRTYERAAELARQVQAEAVRFERLAEKLKEADIIITATSSPHLILRKEDLVDFKKPLLIIDLALPRDVDPQIRSVDGITLFDLEDLTFLIERNLETRRKEIPAALEIIKKEAENLCPEEYLESERAEALLP